MKLRVGEGWDTHALVPGRKLLLGGVEVPYDRGLLGHSDADALLHAITDALLGAAGLGDIGRHFPDTDERFRGADSILLLGAAGLGDIGRHFPDTDERFKGADSILLLTEAALRVRQGGWQIANVDSTVVAQAPKLAPYIEAMRARIAQALDLAPAQVNVKAKTAEKLGPVGMGQSIEARAVVLLTA